MTATSLEEHFTQGVYEDKDHNIFLDIGTDRAPSYHAVEGLEAMFALKDLAMHIGQLSHRVVAQVLCTPGPSTVAAQSSGACHPSSRV